MRKQEIMENSGNQWEKDQNIVSHVLCSVHAIGQSVRRQCIAVVRWNLNGIPCNALFEFAMQNIRNM